MTTLPNHMPTKTSETKIAPKKKAAVTAAKPGAKRVKPSGKRAKLDKPRDAAGRFSRKSALATAQASAPASASGSAPASATIAVPIIISGRRLRMGDAMRSIGLDESKLAATFNRLLDGNEVESTGDAKLLLEVLKECVKHLEPPSIGRGAGSVMPNVPVQLVTVVPRPERPALPAREPAALPDVTGADACAAPESAIVPEAEAQFVEP